MHLILIYPKVSNARILINNETNDPGIYTSQGLQVTKEHCLENQLRG